MIPAGLPIVAAATFAPVATTPATSLREEVRAHVANAPRRVNRLIELALIGAHRCVAGRALAPDTAIYMACTHGTVADAVSMVGDAVRGMPSMPVTFINTSSNMAGFHVAATLGLHSGNHVGSSADFAWEATLELARACGGPALIGAVEECAWPLDAHRVRLGLAPDTPLLETSQWLRLDPGAAAPLAWLETLRYFPDVASVRGALKELPQDCRLQISGEPDTAALSAMREASGREPQLVSTAGYSGMPGALACGRFIEGSERGALVHVSAAKTGACYLLRIRKP